MVQGENIERIASRTDFTNKEAIQHLRDIMRRQGIMHELVRKGIKTGQTISFASGQTLEY